MSFLLFSNVAQYIFCDIMGVIVNVMGTFKVLGFLFMFDLFSFFLPYSTLSFHERAEGEVSYLVDMA
jgi:hypothetical protein